MSDSDTDLVASADSISNAPAWRRRVARAIDVVAALAVFLLFLTPVIALQGYATTAGSILKILAWVYLGVFVLLALLWALKKRRQRKYLTIGMSIMELRPLQVGQATQLVHRPHAQGVDRGLSGRAAAALGMPLIVAALGFFIYELIVYA